MKRKEWIKLAVMVGGFAACWFLPAVTLGTGRVGRAAAEALGLTRWYARAHVLGCLVPAFFIAGAISVFVSQASVMKYLGAGAKKILAYGVGSLSGGVLAVCSCTVLPLFAGIYRMGAGLGPALSLPNMLVIRSVMGTKRTLVYVLLVVVMSTASGVVYGALFT